MENKESAPTSMTQDSQIERIAQTFERSARRWEIIVYPSMIAFVVLAIYGFYLIYNLSRDVHSLATDMHRLSLNVEENMQNMSNDLRAVSHQMEPMDKIANNVEHMAHSVQGVSRNVDNIDNAISDPFSTMFNGMFGGFSISSGEIERFDGRYPPPPQRKIN